MSWRQISKEELAYFAGFIDGEGSISLRFYSGGCLSPKVSVSNTVKKNLLRLQELFGGSISTYKRVKGCKTAYAWYIKSQDGVSNFLSQILPYLRMKKRQAEIVLDFCDRKEVWSRYGGGSGFKPGNYHEVDWENYFEIKELNKRGV